MFRHPRLALVASVAFAALVVAGRPPLRSAAAAVAAYLIFAVGIAVLGAMARPVPEPPPEGELRKVRLTFRCDVCGAEVRMTAAPTDDPEPPRHCQDEMRLTATVDDAI